MNKNIQDVILLEPKNYNLKNDRDIFDLPSEDVIEQYLQADIFVYTTLIESFGIVILEAMAASLPVLAYDVPGVNELVSNKSNGLLASVNDTEQLSKMILSLSKKDIENMGLKSYKLAKILIGI